MTRHHPERTYRLQMRRDAGLMIPGDRGRERNRVPLNGRQRIGSDLLKLVVTDLPPPSSYFHCIEPRKGGLHLLPVMEYERNALGVQCECHPGGHGKQGFSSDGQHVMPSTCLMIKVGGEQDSVGMPVDDLPGMGSRHPIAVDSSEAEVSGAP